jgi:hypothetical protein
MKKPLARSAAGLCCLLQKLFSRFKTPDIKRISRHLKMKEGDFIEKYLLIDEDGDYIANSNHALSWEAIIFCSIYEVRPSDCVRFLILMRMYY